MDSMEARFGHLRQRDTSVDMLRVKMSRRRSQSQKENRDKALNSRRQLDKLPELECSQLDMSVVENVSVVQEKASNAKQVKNAAVEERIKKLARYKEKKELVKEKEKRAREKKGVFKVGLYRPLAPLPQAPAATIKARATTAVVQPQSTRVTRSNMRQQAPKLPQSNDTLPVSRKVEPAVVRSTRRTRIAIVEQVVRAPSTRSANIPPVSVAPVAKDKPAAAPKTRSNAKQSAAPPVGRGRNTRGSNKQAAVKVDEPLEDHRSASPPPPSAEEDEKMVEGPAPEPVPSQADPILPPAPTPSSFAPQGFVFQAPAGLSSFKPTPLTPRSADSFFKPSVPVLHPVPLRPSDNLVTKMELSVPSPAKSPSHSPPRPSPTLAPLCLPSPKEPEHDVPYFRSVVVSETESLTEFCQQWESRVDDVSVPEEMCDRMRTAVGQARLLMKERFGQFSGLVDDCELGRGEKITTCTDLQGFWDMVSYQVEDVNKKFGALKEAESKGWQEESKPPPRQRKVVKKPPSALVPKPAGGAVAKSRLAAIKAAIKAKQQAAEAEKAAQAAGPGSAVDNPAPAPQDPQAETQAPEPPVVVFQGGFFQVESPAKLTGSVRRSTRVSAMPQASPCSVTKFSTSGRTRHSNTAAAAHASPLPCLTLSPAHPTLTPACSTLTPACPSDATPLRTPHTDHEPQSYTLAQSSPTRVSLCFSPVKEALMDTQSEEGPSNQPELASVQNDVTPDQPEPESMQEAVACDQSELVSEPTVCPEEHYVSCESEEIGQSPSNTQQLTNDEQHQEAFSLTVLATEEPNQLELQDRKEALEAYDTSLPISPGLPLSPSLPHTQVRSPAFSFNLSPTPARPRLTEASLSPLSCLVPPSSPPAVQVSLGFPADADVPVTVTPDTSITEGIPGLDFERYLQPAVRCSLSPRELAVAEEMLSPMAIDVEMETPLAPSGEPPQEEVSTPTAFPSLAQMLTPRTTQPVESRLLLFTPDQMDRVRQSICPSDLMSFTPPSD
ncbi:disks large-associated protein 5-like isoform X1 [Coregonus clupeaformis]|uniref:disks large-associated protein 5-like isoform X1 n=1 Tax=Coregonus clupeaformis TaxID=59861 RepID=UPI001E1C88A7|nr:disks large-associated protein 5-like isoform X1 [Coregonus clupeaformis]